MPNGISISQSGVDISKASDYLKALDSRWKVLEVHTQGSITIKLPAIAAGSSSDGGYEQRVLVIEHGLNFFPLFEAGAFISSGTPKSTQSGASSLYPILVYSDAQNLYLFPNYAHADGQNSVSIQVTYRVYNLDVQQAYAAAISPTSGATTNRSDFGVKILDGTTISNVIDNSSVGFSLDTTKKSVQIHSVSTQSVDNVNNKIYHTVGYPPTYLLATSPYAVFASFSSAFSIPFRTQVLGGPIFEPVVRVVATNTYLQFTGIQSVFSGTFCFVVLKDPVGLIG